MLLIVPSHASVSELSYPSAAPEQLHTAGNLSLSLGHMTDPANQPEGELQALCKLLLLLTQTF